MLASNFTLSKRDYERIEDAVYKHCGIMLHEGKQELVHARMTKLLRKSKHGTATEYLDSVLDNAKSPGFMEFIDAMSTNLTSFFRESGHFDFLASEFLPALIARKQAGASRKIRAWSAACSTGEEPLTIAMVMREVLDASKCNLEARILATDISTRVLEHAKAGFYEKARTATVPPAYRAKYLYNATTRPGHLEPSPAIRSMIHFAHLNLMEAWPFSGPFDFIFCRNVMIYFDKPTQQKLIERFYQMIDSGGLLFTGHSESLTGVAHKFQYVRPTIYRKP
jgi:chemotaxis protein methyltransferase CheR